MRYRPFDILNRDRQRYNKANNGIRLVMRRATFLKPINGKIFDQPNSRTARAWFKIGDVSAVEKGSRF